MKKLAPLRSMKEEAKILMKEYLVLKDRREDQGTHSYVRREFMRASVSHMGCEFDNFYVGDNPKKKDFLNRAKEYSENVVENIVAGKNIVFAGNPGTGKDHMMMAIAKSVFDAGSWVVRINGARLRQEVMDAMRDGKVTSLVDSLTCREVLWISDPALSDDPASRFFSEIFYLIIDTMYCRRRPIWVTVNAMNGTAISKMVGAQAYDRMRDRSLTFICDWPSYRDSV